MERSIESIGIEMLIVAIYCILCVDVRFFVLLHLGTVTDGEFCSLRTKGESRALHVWQLIHDARQQARNLSKKKLEGCLLAKSGIIVFVFFPIQGSVVQSWISPNPWSKFNLLSWFEYFCTSVHFKTLENRTSDDPDKISTKISPS